MRYLLPLVLLSAPVSLLAQGGRFEESKRLGMAYLKEGKYDRAAAKLEEVHETDPSDSMVAEALAVAYMNGDERKQDYTLDDKAKAILVQQLQKGGRALFHVQLNLSSTFYSGSTTKTCGGTMTLAKGKLAFLCERGDTGGDNSFDFTPAAVKETSARYDKGNGMFFIKTAKRTYNFHPASWDKRHSQIILELITQYF